MERSYKWHTIIQDMDHYMTRHQPNDRGRCYFIGGNSAMNLTAFANIIDNGTTMFNLSSWFGGWNTQDDNAALTVTFQNSALMNIGNSTILGPFLAVDRNITTCSIFRNIIGLVPVNARQMTVMVNITRVNAGQSNDGSVDNIRFEIACIENIETTTEQGTTSHKSIHETTEITVHSTQIVETTTNDLLQPTILSTFTSTISYLHTTYQTYTTTMLTTEGTTLTNNKTNGLSSIFLIPPPCMNPYTIGLQCNISSTVCDMLKPCLNNGTCTNMNTSDFGYNCSCPSEFIGARCEFDHRVCKEDTCLNNGICNKTSNTTFNCNCSTDWQGICRLLSHNYSCECLGDNYSGRQCEITATKISVYRIVSKSFASIAIFSMISVAIFILVMDILKYFLNIDPHEKESEQIQTKKLKATRKHPLIQKFTYIN
ncbi:hypothetical protein I4U23_015496 [Adineta vaga]|nr:hypothetical protein I4U23_015496 [Adineta vaga]